MSASGDSWLPGPALLFCPGDRPERFAKAAASSDMVIVDLEDGVAPERKELARIEIRRCGLRPECTVVRLPPVGHPDHDLDRLAVEAAGLRIVMLAKVQTAADLDRMEGLLTIALCETPAGVLNADSIAAHPHVAGLMWGGEDLTASLGGTASRGTHGVYTDVVRYARSRLLLAAGAAGKAAIDGVHLAIDDEAGLRRETEDSVRSGFRAKACIHPRQAAIVRQCYKPGAEQQDWARRVLDQAAEHGSGAFALDGRMVDGPLLAQARRILQL